jgi:fluoride exporter
MLQNLLFIGLGGFLGATSRYLVSLLFSQSPPVGTLIVNVVGSLVIGIFLALALQTGLKQNSYLYLFFVTGVCGAFTTFSAFSQHNLVFLIEKNFMGFTLNVMANIALCLIATFVGYVLIVKFVNT